MNLDDQKDGIEMELHQRAFLCGGTVVKWTNLIQKRTELEEINRQ